MDASCAHDLVWGYTVLAFSLPCQTKPPLKTLVWSPKHTPRASSEASVHKKGR